MAEAGDSGWKGSVEAVVGEVQVVEVVPRGEVEGGGEAVAVEVEELEVGELGELLSRTGQVEVLQNDSGNSAFRRIASDAKPRA